MFHEKEFQNKNQTEFRIEKVRIRREKLYVKQKGYDNLFIGWIDKKDTFTKIELFSRTRWPQ